MTNAKYLTVEDKKNGYWHISRSEESRLFTTFNTPSSKYCFKRLPYGLTFSGNAFQQQLDQVLSGISGVTGIFDDVLMKGDTAEQHDTDLHELLTRCQNVGTRLNREKIQYKQTIVKLYGHVLTNKGLHADPSKIDAIVQMPPPHDVK